MISAACENWVLNRPQEAKSKHIEGEDDVSKSEREGDVACSSLKFSEPLDRIVAVIGEVAELALLRCCLTTKLGATTRIK
jgi:hypothetical protein